MPSPKSPLTLLAEQLSQAPTLKGFATKIALGVKKLNDQRSPRSIVFYPRSGPLANALSRSNSYLDMDLELVFRLWGADIDEAWDLRARLIEAMSSVGLAGGPFWSGVVENWDDDKDTAAQGTDLEVVLSVRLSASDKTAARTVKVENTSLTREQILLEDLSAVGTQAYVGSTYGLPTSGILYIDDEKLSYSAVTSDSFVGLVRGLSITEDKPTTAAAHVVGAAVRVTPAP
jgi:hypothetical protein